MFSRTRDGRHLGAHVTAGVINYRKIYSRTGLATGSSQAVTWNNPPEQTSLSYWAYAHPPVGSGQHGTTHGQVEITSIKHSYTRDNYNGDKQSVTITVKNTGIEVTGYDVYQSWVTAA
jgi:hypothetical protein